MECQQGFERCFDLVIFMDFTKVNHHEQPTTTIWEKILLVHFFHPHLKQASLRYLMGFPKGEECPKGGGCIPNLVYMVFYKYRGTPKWMVYDGKPSFKWMIWGDIPLFSETSHMIPLRFPPQKKNPRLQKPWCNGLKSLTGVGKESRAV